MRGTGRNSLQRQLTVLLSSLKYQGSQYLLPARQLSSKLMNSVLRNNSCYNRQLSVLD
jgi:hypothetical protein